MLNQQHQALVEKCKVNDRAAQEQLYKLFHWEMLRLSCRYLKSDDLAKEALNQAFLKIFQNIADYSAQKGELGGWIRTIVVRTSIDLRRKELRFNTEELSDSHDEPHIPAAVLAKLYAEDLLEYIRQLPQATQIVFNLSVVEGYNHQEIAEMLDIGEATSRWHLSDAKRKLRAMILPQQKNSNGPSTETKLRKP
ncbi:MAG: RNA polymerase sigma factor [Bacteroidota bacterium]